MPKDGPRVIGVTEARIFSVSYIDHAGNIKGMPIALIDGEVAKFKDDQMVIDRQGTPDFIMEGVKAHVEALSEEGDQEA